VALMVETSLASGRDILRGIARYVREHGPWSITHEARSLEELVPAWLPKWQGDGIIARVQNRRVAAAVAATRLPAVDVLGIAPGVRLPLVHVDDEAIATAAAAHLLERGFRHFGYVGIGGENWSRRRQDAFARRVRSRGHGCRVLEVRRYARETWEEQEERLTAWVRALPKPAGVMVCSDQRGPQVLEACRRAGAAVPDQVAVIGVDDDEPLCEVADPPLSSVHPDHRRVGYAAAALLDRLMRGARAPRRPLLLPPRGIVARPSTDVLAIEDPDVAAAVHFIRDRACDGIQVDDVVAHVPMSRSVLQRRFRALLGRTIHDEILDARLKRARMLLAETRLPVSAVAEKAGFNHPEYLGVVFRSREGTTPGAYRRRLRAGKGR
jgi:LacI family transcriptional regulator